MADPAMEARDEQGLHDLVTTFTRSLMHENTTVPMSVAAKLAQFISELYVLWRDEPAQPAQPAALREILNHAVETAIQNPIITELKPEPARPMTKRGKPRLTPEEISARRKAVWTAEKRAEHRRRTLERMEREQQQSRIPQSIPA